MKVQIVYLSPADDVDSTRDMLAWVQTPRVLLVWPDKGRVLNERLELVRISRYATRRNIQVGLLTFDTEVRQIAHELSMPVFDSLEELPEERWRRDASDTLSAREARQNRELKFVLEPPRERVPDWANQIGKRRTSFPVSLFLVVTVVLLVLVGPSARVIISTERLSQQTKIAFDFEGDAEPVAAALWIPSHKVSVEASASGEWMTTGWMRIPSAKARGSVQFTNHTEEEVRIPFNTILLSGTEEGVRFRTLNTALLQAGVGSQVDVQVEAVGDGEAGNVPPSSIVAIEGPLGLRISVENESSTAGGKDELVPMVTASDYEALESTLIQNLIAEAEEKARSNLSADQVMIDGEVWAIEILEQTVNHEIGQVAVVLEMHIEAMADFIVYSSQDFRDVIVDQLSQESGEKWEIEPNSIEVHPAIDGQPISEQGGVMEILVGYETYESIDRKELVRLIAGRSPASVTGLLHQAIPSLVESKVSLSPQWLPFMPIWGERISLQLDLE